jgi:hypothetical protein
MPNRQKRSEGPKSNGFRTNQDSAKPFSRTKSHQVARLVFCSPIPSVTGNDGAKEEGEEGGEGTINVGEGVCAPGGEARLLFGKEEQDSNGG